MVAHLDDYVGRIVKRLEELGLRDNTLIVFTSDNGAAWEGDTGPFKGGKTDLHEGGIRVPMIASWPGKIRAGRTSDVLGHSNDLLPTFCAAAGVAVPAGTPLDGINLLPHLTAGTPIDRGTMFWQMDLFRQIQRRQPKPKPYATEIAREGKWKLLAMEGKPVELFDIESDPGETNNLLDQHPEVIRQLSTKLATFLAAPRDRSGMR